uniref:Gypsy retrotransposon integrase-like protein 1 n=1 Tax=Xenopus tropicalis TaxID=8364 RepID=A0A803JYW4_XENTR
MLIDTGASVSIIHTLDPQSHPLSTGQKVGLEAFQGSHAEAYQSSKTKLLIADAAFDLSALLMTLPNSMSILGSNFLKQHEAVIDFTNSKIWFKGNGNYCVISDAHAVSAIKNPEFFEMPTHSDPRVAQIIHECTDVFGKHKHDCGRLEGEVSIPGRAHEPQKQYPIPKASESYIQNTIDSLLQQGVLRVCESTTNSPIWPVEKPDGSWRLTIDYRKLNSVTPACAPVVRETPTLLSSIPPRAKYFSSIDICNSFWNIAVELRSQYKLAFTWKDQQYTWNCLPQGLHNSPTIYHKKMAAVLKGFTKPENLLQYVDDLLLATETEEEHLSLLKELLHLLHRAGLKVNPKKCQFMQTSVTFLGMNITPEGKLPDKHKMDTIQRLNLPASKTALRSFLGLVQYQRDFIPFFADKARPLYDLLKKEVPEEDIRGEWREPHTQAFNVLKQSMMEATALLTPDPKKRFHLEVAATDTALAAVLCQEKHGKLKPIAYASRVLSAVEIKFTACERHLLATFWAIEHFTYITGLQSLTLHSPHTPLNLLLKPGDTTLSSARLSKWTLMLMQRDLDITPKQTTLLPAFLLYDGEPHKCPLPSNLNLPPNPLSSDQVPGIDVYCDGSSYHDQGTPYTGFSVILPNHIVMHKCLPHSSQYAELAAIACTLERCNTEACNIYSDSAYAVNTLTMLPLYVNNGFRSSDGKTLTHASLLKYIWDLLQARTLPCALVKVKGHSKGSVHSEKNSLADQCAKKAAKQADLWSPPSAPEISALTGNTPPDLVSLQKAYEPYKLVKEWHLKGKNELAPNEWAKYTILSPGDSQNQILLYQRDLPFPVVCVPPECADDFFQIFHSHPVGGHFSAEKTLHKILQSVWWPSIKDDVNSKCSSCLPCLQVNPPSCTNRSLLRSTPPAEGPWSQIQIDFIGPLPKTPGGFSHCLVVIDVFSKWIEAFPTRNQKALTAAKVLISELFSRWGLPKVVASDRGTSFTGQVFSQLQKLLDIKHELHIAFHPQSSGTVERGNRTLKTMLTKFCAEKPSTWAQMLPLCLMAIRSTPHSTTGVSPYQAMTGRLMRMPGNLLIPSATPLLQGAVTEAWVKNVAEHINEVNKFVARNIGHSKSQIKKYFDKKVRLFEYNVGDLVMVRDFGKKEHSFTPIWRGPFTVVDKASPATYLVKTVGGKGKVTLKWYHINQMKNC